MAARLTIATFKAAKKALREDRRRGLVKANERVYLADRKGMRK